MQIEKRIASYSTGRGKTGKTDAPIENELDIVRNWNFIRLVILAYFFARESFKLICIFYDFEAPPFKNRSFSDFETCIIGFGVKNRFQNISNFLDLDYFEKIKISINYDNQGNLDFFQNNPNLKSWICFGNDFLRRIQWCRFQSQKTNGFQAAELWSRRICKLAWNSFGV